MVKESVCNTGDLGQSLGQEDSLEKEWLSTPVFLPGAFHEQYGQRSLAGPWGHKESDTAEQLTQVIHIIMIFCIKS